MMSVCNNKCLVVLNQGKKAQFINPDVNGALQQAPQFVFEPGKTLVNVTLVENQYVVAVFETHVAVYNATTGDLLQTDANLEGRKDTAMKFKYKSAAVKVQTNNADSISDVYVLSYNLVEKKQTIQSEIYMMKEIGWEQ